MRSLFLAACIAAASPVYAQYFEHHYGTTTFDVGHHGMYTTMTAPLPQPAGLVISGIMQTPTAPLNRLMVSRTDNNGNVFGAPYFNRIYNITIPGAPALSVNDAKVIELPNNLGFAVAGSCTQNATGLEFIYYLRLTPNGNPINPVFYYSTGDQRFRLHGVRLATAGNAVYLVGDAATPAANLQRFFILKVGIPGNMLWGSTYVSPIGQFFESAYDVVEDPSSVPMANLVCVVGTTRNTNGNTDAFFLQVNPNTGAPLPPGIMNIYGTPNSYDHFYSIDRSNDAMPAPPMTQFGYVIGGYSNAGNAAGVNDSWVIRMDNTLVTGWSRLIDYGNGGINNECRDVVESFNPTILQYEYYAGGNTANGFQGGPDMELNKLDRFGNLMWQGTYGDQGNQRLAAIDEVPANTTAGINNISLYGNTQPGLVGGQDLCIFNVNSNGQTACDFKVHGAPFTFGPDLYNRKEFLVRAPFTVTQGTFNFTTYQDVQKCFVQAFPVITPKSADAPAIQLDVYGTGESAMTLEVNGAASAPAELMVTDITGRILYQGQVMLQEGTTYLPVDLSGQLSSGIYMVTLRQGAVVTTTKVMIAK